MDKLVLKSLISSGLVGSIFLVSVLNLDFFRYFILIVFVITLGLGFFVLDLKPTLANTKKALKYLMVPVLVNTGGIYFISTLFQDVLKLALVAVFVLVNYFLWISLRKVYNLRERAALFYRNLLISLTFLAVFLGLSGVFRLYIGVSLSEQKNFYQALVIIITFVITYYGSSFMASENGADMVKFREYNLVNALVCSELAWISSFWVVNYPVIGNTEKSAIGGTPLPALLISIIFYFIWGVISHKVDRTLDRKILNEYIFITFVFILVLFLSARWLPVS